MSQPAPAQDSSEGRVVKKVRVVKRVAKAKSKTDISSADSSKAIAPKPDIDNNIPISTYKDRLLFYSNYTFAADQDGKGVSLHRTPYGPQPVASAQASSTPQAMHVTDHFIIFVHGNGDLVIYDHEYQQVFRLDAATYLLKQSELAQEDAVSQDIPDVVDTDRTDTSLVDVSPSVDPQNQHQRDPVPQGFPLDESILSLSAAEITSSPSDKHYGSYFVSPPPTASSVGQVVTIHPETTESPTTPTDQCPSRSFFLQTSTPLDTDMVSDIVVLVTISTTKAIYNIPCHLQIFHGEQQGVQIMYYPMYSMLQLTNIVHSTGFSQFEPLPAPPAPQQASAPELEVPSATDTSTDDVLNPTKLYFPLISSTRLLYSSQFPSHCFLFVVTRDGGLYIYAIPVKLFSVLAETDTNVSDPLLLFVASFASPVSHIGSIRMITDSFYALLTTKNRSYVLVSKLNDVIYALHSSPSGLTDRGLAHDHTPDHQQDGYNPSTTQDLQQDSSITSRPTLFAIIPIGSQLRMDEMGICFANSHPSEDSSSNTSTTVDNPTDTENPTSDQKTMHIYCSRPGRRLWTADLYTGQVQSTMKLTFSPLSIVQPGYYTSLYAPNDHVVDIIETPVQAENAPSDDADTDGCQQDKQPESELQKSTSDEPADSSKQASKTKTSKAKSGGTKKKIVKKKIVRVVKQSPADENISNDNNNDGDTLGGTDTTSTDLSEKSPETTSHQVVDLPTSNSSTLSPSSASTASEEKNTKWLDDLIGYPNYITMNDVNVPLHFHQLLSNQHLVVGLTHGVGVIDRFNGQLIDTSSESSSATPLNTDGNDDQSKPTLQEHQYRSSSSIVSFIDPQNIQINIWIPFQSILNLEVCGSRVYVLHHTPSTDIWSTNKLQLHHVQTTLSVIDLLSPDDYMFHVRRYCSTGPILPPPRIHQTVPLLQSQLQPSEEQITSLLQSIDTQLQQPPFQTFFQLHPALNSPVGLFTLWYRLLLIFPRIPLPYILLSRSLLYATLSQQQGDAHRGGGPAVFSAVRSAQLSSGESTTLLAVLSSSQNTIATQTIGDKDGDSLGSTLSFGSVPPCEGNLISEHIVFTSTHILPLKKLFHPLSLLVDYIASRIREFVAIQKNQLKLYTEQSSRQAMESTQTLTTSSTSTTFLPHQFLDSMIGFETNVNEVCVEADGILTNSLSKFDTECQVIDKSLIEFDDTISQIDRIVNDAKTGLPSTKPSDDVTSPTPPASTETDEFDTSPSQAYLQQLAVLDIRIQIEINTSSLVEEMNTSQQMIELSIKSLERIITALKEFFSEAIQMIIKTHEFMLTIESQQKQSDDDNNDQSTHAKIPTPIVLSDIQSADDITQYLFYITPADLTQQDRSFIETRTKSIGDIKALVLLLSQFFSMFSQLNPHYSQYMIPPPEQANTAASHQEQQQWLVRHTTALSKSPIEHPFGLVNQISSLIATITSLESNDSQLTTALTTYIESFMSHVHNIQTTVKTLTGEKLIHVYQRYQDVMSYLASIRTKFSHLQQRRSDVGDIHQMAANAIEEKHQLKVAEEKRVKSILQAKADAEKKARDDALRKAKEEAERKAKEEAERKAKQEAERIAKIEADKKAKLEAERKAKEEQKKAKEEADKKAKEDARKAKEEAQKAKEEARKAKEEADRQAREAKLLEKKAKEDAEAQAKAKKEAEAKAKREAEAEAKAKKEAEAKAKLDAEAEKKVQAQLLQRAKDEAAQKEQESAAAAKALQQQTEEQNQQVAESLEDHEKSAVASDVVATTPVLSSRQKAEKAIADLKRAKEISKAKKAHQEEEERKKQQKEEEEAAAKIALEQTLLDSNHATEQPPLPIATLTSELSHSPSTVDEISLQLGVGAGGKSKRRKKIKMAQIIEDPEELPQHQRPLEVISPVSLSLPASSDVAPLTPPSNLSRHPTSVSTSASEDPQGRSSSTSTTLPILSSAKSSLLGESSHSSKPIGKKATPPSPKLATAGSTSSSPALHSITLNSSADDGVGHDTISLASSAASSSYSSRVSLALQKIQLLRHQQEELRREQELKQQEEEEAKRVEEQKRQYYDEQVLLQQSFGIVTGEEPELVLPLHITILDLDHNIYLDEGDGQFSDIYDIDDDGHCDGNDEEEHQNEFIHPVDPLIDYCLKSTHPDGLQKPIISFVDEDNARKVSVEIASSFVSCHYFQETDEAVITVWSHPDEFNDQSLSLFETTAAIDEFLDVGYHTQYIIPQPHLSIKALVDLHGVSSISPTNKSMLRYIIQQVTSLLLLQQFSRRPPSENFDKSSPFYTIIEQTEATSDTLQLLLHLPSQVMTSSPGSYSVSNHLLEQQLSILTQLFSPNWSESSIATAAQGPCGIGTQSEDYRQQLLAGISCILSASPPELSGSHSISHAPTTQTISASYVMSYFYFLQLLLKYPLDLLPKQESYVPTVFMIKKMPNEFSPLAFQDDSPSQPTDEPQQFLPFLRSPMPTTERGDDTFEWVPFNDSLQQLLRSFQALVGVYNKMYNYNRHGSGDHSHSPSDSVYHPLYLRLLEWICMYTTRLFQCTQQVSQDNITMVARLYMLHLISLFLNNNKNNIDALSASIDDINTQQQFLRSSPNSPFAKPSSQSMMHANNHQHYNDSAGSSTYSHAFGDHLVQLPVTMESSPQHTAYIRQQLFWKEFLITMVMIAEWSGEITVASHALQTRSSDHDSSHPQWSILTSLASIQFHSPTSHMGGGDTRRFDTYTILREALYTVLGAVSHQQLIKLYSSFQPQLAYSRAQLVSSLMVHPQYPFFEVHDFIHPSIQLAYPYLAQSLLIHALLSTYMVRIQNDHVLSAATRLHTAVLSKAGLDHNSVSSIPIMTPSAHPHGLLHSMMSTVAPDLVIYALLHTIMGSLESTFGPGAIDSNRQLSPFGAASHTGGMPPALPPIAPIQILPISKRGGLRDATQSNSTQPVKIQTTQFPFNYSNFVPSFQGFSHCTRSSFSAEQSGLHHVSYIPVWGYSPIILTASSKPKHISISCMFQTSHESFHSVTCPHPSDLDIPIIHVTMAPFQAALAKIYLPHAQITVDTMLPPLLTMHNYTTLEKAGKLRSYTELLHAGTGASGQPVTSDVVPSLLSSLTSLISNPSSKQVSSTRNSSTPRGLTTGVGRSINSPQDQSRQHTIQHLDDLLTAIKHAEKEADPIEITASVFDVPSTTRTATRTPTRAEQEKNLELFFSKEKLQTTSQNGQMLGNHLLSAINAQNNPWISQIQAFFDSHPQIHQTLSKFGGPTQIVHLSSQCSLCDTPLYVPTPQRTSMGPVDTRVSNTPDDIPVAFTQDGLICHPSCLKKTLTDGW